jgi:hypothetical protein
MRVFDVPARSWKGKTPCAIFTLHLLGEAGLMAVNLFSLRVHAILGGVSIFYKQF